MTSDIGVILVAAFAGMALAWLGMAWQQQLSTGNHIILLNLE